MFSSPFHYFRTTDIYKRTKIWSAVRTTTHYLAELPVMLTVHLTGRQTGAPNKVEVLMVQMRGKRDKYPTIVTDNYDD